MEPLLAVPDEAPEAEPEDETDDVTPEAVAALADLKGRLPFVPAYVTPATVLTYMKRTLPFLPKSVHDRRPGRYPRIDAAAPLSERIAESTMSPGHEMGPERWLQLSRAIIGVGQQVVGEDLTAFNTLTANAMQAALREFNDDALEVRSLYGGDVGFDVANAAWWSGYAACVNRLLLDSELRGTPFPEPARDLSIVQERAKSLRMAPPGVWIDAGTLAPLTGTLVSEVLDWWVDEFFPRLSPLFGDSQEMVARAELHRIAMGGYAIGRAQFEQVSLEAST
jgi:hypothetical protein